MTVQRWPTSVPFHLALLSATSCPAAADPQALTPVQVASVGAVHLGASQLQGSGEFTSDPEGLRGHSTYTAGPTLKFGILPRLELDVGSPYRVGSQSSANSGNNTASVLYEINDQRTYLPGFGFRGGYSVSYGAGRDSTRYEARGIATKWLGSTERSPRLHLNVIWYHLTQPDSTQRRDQLQLGAAYSRLVSQNTALVIDLVHGARAESGKNQTVVDVGLRHELGRGWTVSAAAGAGNGQQSPTARLFFAIQNDFQIF